MCVMSLPHDASPLSLCERVTFCTFGVSASYVVENISGYLFLQRTKMCVLSFSFVLDKEPSSSLGIPALPIVASTTSSVAFILLLVVLFVLVQPKLKSFHHSRYDTLIYTHVVESFTCVTCFSAHVSELVYKEAKNKGQNSRSRERRSDFTVWIIHQLTCKNINDYCWHMREFFFS